MRWIELKCNDCQMFHEAISPAKYAFLMVHKDDLKNMWHEQGRKFWLQFLIAYRMYQFKYGFVQDAYSKAKIPESFYFGIIDEAFVYIHQKFIEGTFSMARSIIEEIVIVAQNERLLGHFWRYSSLVRIPHFPKETRDAFKNLFGDCGHNVPLEIRAFLQAPVYCHFVGALTNILQAWLLSPRVDQERIKAMEEDPNLRQKSQQWVKHLKGNFALYLQCYWQEKLDTLVFLQGDPAMFSIKFPNIDFDLDGNEDELSDSQSISPDPTCSKHKQYKKKKKKKVSQLRKHIKSLHMNNAEKTDNQGNIPNNVEPSKIHSQKYEKYKEQSSIAEVMDRYDITSSDNLVAKMNNLTVDKEEKGKTKSTASSKANHKPETVKEKLDIIEDTVKRTGGLGIEEFMLLLQAGKQLMGRGDSADDADIDTKTKSERKKIKLHKCAFCKNEEPSPKTFKKCARCKSENFVNPRYYCSRECQVEDWEEWHREEHRANGTQTVTI